MTYRTMACVMALIVGLAVPAGAASFWGGFFDEPIFQSDAYKQLVNIKAKTRGVAARNFAVKTAAQNNDVLAATAGKGGSVNVVDNALLVSVNGNKVADQGITNGLSYDKTAVTSFTNNFNNSTGVANINLASGNLNVQKTYYSGPDLSASGLLANAGSANLTTIRK
jgi:hypothetical protein